LSYSEKFLVPGFSPVLETLSLGEKYLYWDFFPALQTLSLSKNPCTGIFPVHETLSLSKKFLVLGFTRYFGAMAQKKSCNIMKISLTCPFAPFTKASLLGKNT